MSVSVPEELLANLHETRDAAITLLELGAEQVTSSKILCEMMGLTPEKAEAWAKACAVIRGEP